MKHAGKEPPRNHRATRSARSRAFTLVELVVASLIGVMIAGATATALSQMFRVRTTSQARQQAFFRADGLLQRLELDAQSLVRDAELKFTRLRILSGGDPSNETDDLLMLSRSLRPIRSESEEGAEGGEYEVQYRIESGAFWRRVDAAFDEYQDGGGIATPIAGGAVSLSIQASDGNDWFDSWDSDTDGLPHAIRVVATAKSDDGRATATSRRVIAIDRVPIPPEPADTTQTDQNNNSNTPQQPSGADTAGQGSGGGSTGRGGGRGGGRPRDGGGDGQGRPPGGPGPGSGTGPRMGPGAGPGPGGPPPGSSQGPRTQPRPQTPSRPPSTPPKAPASRGGRG